jgi:hypothetical protein
MIPARFAFRLIYDALEGRQRLSPLGHLRLCRPVSGAAGQPQEADSPNSIEPT